MSATAPRHLADWRSDAFTGIASADSTPSLAGAALLSACGPMPGQWVCMASPVHVTAGMTDLSMAQDGILELHTAETRRLAQDFNAVFANSGVRLVDGHPALLFCVFDDVLEVVTHEPAEAIGQDLFGLQPSGRDAPRLRRLMSEMELWLHEHPLNRARLDCGNAVITGIWLWGGGRIPATFSGLHGWTSGRDPLFAAFGNAARLPPVGADGRRPPGVLVCDVAPGEADWEGVEQTWLQPVAAALRKGEIEQLTLSLDNHAITIMRTTSWRFWRRSRPWRNSFALSKLQGTD